MKKIYNLTFLLFVLSALNAQDLVQVFKSNNTFSGVNSIVVSGDFAKVAIEKGDSVTVKTELQATKQQEGYTISSVVENGILKIDVQKPSANWISHAGSVVITMNDNQNLEVLTSSGYIDVSNLSGATYKLESSSGKITTKNIKGNVVARNKTAIISISNIEGTVEAINRTGPVYIDGVNGKTNAISYSGEVTIDNAKGDVKSETTDSKQTLKNIDGTVFIKTNSGDLKLSDSKGTISSVSASGNLNLFNTTGVFNLTATKGSIIGARIKLTANATFTTTEGKIKFSFVNEEQDMSFLCQSENSYIVAYGNSKKKKLKHGKGALVITATSTTGAQSYNK